MKNLTAKNLLKEVRALKKESSRMPQWYYALWEYSSYGSNRGDDPFGGEETADYITDQSQYVAKYFAQVMKQNGINIKMDNYPLDDGNNTNIKNVWGGQADNSGMVAWGFFSNDDRPYVMFEKKIDGKWAHYFEHGPKYKDGDPIKQIRNAKKWLLGSIAGLDTELGAFMDGNPRMASVEDQVVVVAEVRTGKIPFTRGELWDMVDDNGNVKPGYQNGDNLPKWIHMKGYNKKLVSGFMGLTEWVPNPEAKEFLRPFGMKPWRKLDNKSMKQVGQILQILGAGHPYYLDGKKVLDVKSTD